MQSFPYMTDYVNQVLGKEKMRLDYIVLRPILLVFYFFMKLVVFPLKFFIHRVPYGFEARCIDFTMAVGMKYLASRDAAELLIRHVQIEPLLYRHLLLPQASTESGETAKSGETADPEGTAESEETTKTPRRLNGIEGDFNVRSLKDIVSHNMTIGHDELSYEIIDRFDKESFLTELEELRRQRPEDHEALGKEVLEINAKHSLGWLGCTNVVIFVVMAITFFADLRTAMRALNSFDSDSILLWCLKHLYAEHPDVMIDLDFYMQVYSNRSHYDSGAFFSDPSQYLYYHIVFDEYAYHLLRERPAEVG